MDKAQFEHVIAAAANATGLDEFIIVGSQAILGAVAEPPPDLLESMEVDLYPKADPAQAEHVDGAMGDESRFAQLYGVYAHGVGPETVLPPAGWEERLVEVRIPPRPASAREPVAYCLERHDLVLAKCARGIQRDWDYARIAIEEGIVDPPILLERIPDMPVPDEQKKLMTETLEGIAARSASSRSRTSG